jgi:general secretion pathway protein E
VVQTQDRPLDLSEVLDWLVEDRMIAAETAKTLKKQRHFRRESDHPLVVIAEQKWKNLTPPYRALDMESLTEWMARRCGLGYFHIDPLKVDFSAITEVMSNAYAGRYRILPVEVTLKEIVIATAQPFVREWEKELTPILRKEIRRVLANPLDILRYQVEFYNLARSIKKATTTGGGPGAALSSFEQLVDMGAGNRTFDANDQNIVHVVDWLWQYAFDQRASDIHMEPRREVGIVRFRIDGVLHQVYQVPMSVMTAMTSRIKLLGRMDVIEKRRPQDGRIKTRTPSGQEVELRLSTMPTAFGEKLVMRVFDPEVLVRDFADLGFSPEDLNRWRSMTSSPNGILFVTGPTGSGKTTTLYSTLKQLATPEVNVCTIEDPIEMIEPAFNQMQVQGSIEIGFADGVKALMRQDPDIIMIGEIRDLGTAEMAIQAALTGHLVLSTLHTNDAPAAITRLLDLGVPSYLIPGTVLGVMAQRLIRTLCPQCKKPVPTTDEDTERWNRLVSPWKAQVPSHLHQPGGCLECHQTGFTGRVGIYEIMVMSPELRKLITPTTDSSKLRELCYREGMLPLRVAGAMKVAAGVTSLDEIIRVAPPRDEV